MGVYAKNKNGSELALSLKCWSPQVTLLTDGKNNLKPSEVEVLNANSVATISLPIARIEGNEGQIKKIIFKNGEERLCDALFFVNGYSQHCNLAETFGCDLNKKGVVKVDKYQKTNIEGLYVAGDAARDMHFVVVAAAEGAKAAVSINKELQQKITEQHQSL